MPSEPRIGRTRIAVDLSKMDLNKAQDIAAQLGPGVMCYKMHALAIRAAEVVVGNIRLMADSTAKVWLDYKLHDTPDTVAEQAAQIKACGANMVTVHASGGPDMIRAAVENGPEMVIAVTQLTSLKNDLLEQLFGQGRIEESLQTMVRWTVEGGAHAIVCPATRVALIHQLAPNIKLIVPGTRMAGQSADDQNQVDTPFNTIRGGAYALVGGRHVTKDKDPMSALDAMAAEVERALTA